jgi:hypothetical protein
MPKKKKKGKREADDFDDMLADFKASDLATASSSKSRATQSHRGRPRVLVQMRDWQEHSSIQRQ